MSLNPEAYLAWESLTKAISSSLGIRRYELVTLAAAQAIGSTRCRLAHGKKTLKIIGEEQLLAIARDFHHGLRTGRGTTSVECLWRPVAS